MADDPEEANQGPEEGSRDQQQQSRALDSITDHVEERQVDASRVQQAMASIAASADAGKISQRAREKELAAVKVNPADVDVIVSELEIDRKLAERRLREHKGNAIEGLRSFLQ